MARITVEDCIDKFPSRFELVLVASNRARKLYTGENPTVEIDNDKNISVDIKKRLIIDFVGYSYLVYHYIHLKNSRLKQNMYLKMDQDRSQKRLYSMLIM